MRNNILKNPQFLLMNRIHKRLVFLRRADDGRDFEIVVRNIPLMTGLNRLHVDGVEPDGGNMRCEFRKKSEFLLFHTVAGVHLIHGSVGNPCRTILRHRCPDQGKPAVEGTIKKSLERLIGMHPEITAPDML